MRPVILFSLIVLVGAAFAFDVSPYLLVNETNASVAKEYFTLNHTVYTLINISGKPSFLIKVDSLVLDKGEMASVLKDYYTTKYFLTPNETNSLRTDFLTFNASRNNGGRFKGQEENACRKALFFNLYPCVDNASCIKTATLVCAGYAPATGCGSYKMFLAPVVDFANASDSLELVMADIFSKFDTMNESNVVEYINQMKLSGPLIENYSTRLESTIFRIPAVGDTCPKCYGICPDIVFDDAALEKAETELNTLSAKVAPISNYQQTVDILYNNTQHRLLESENADKRLYYTSIYETIKTPARQIEANATQALQLVENSTVRARLVHIQELEADIEGSINASNFTGLNETIGDYSALVKSLNASIPSLMEPYQNASDASTTATVYLFIAEGKATSPDDTKRLNVIKEQKLLLDQQFKPGLTATQYADIAGQYATIIEEEREFVGSKTLGQSFYLFAGGLTNRVVGGADDIVSQAKPLTLLERKQLSLQIPWVLTFLIFFGASSVILFVFSFYYGTFPKPIHKLILAILAALLMFLVGLVSISAYLSLDKSYDKMEYSEFIAIAHSSKNLSIVLQPKDADNATLTAMRACASSVSAELSKQNLSTQTYELSGTSCKRGNATIQNCTDVLEGPLMLFTPSAVSSSASYYGLLTKEAVFAGNAAYYITCAPLVALKVA